MNKVSKAKVLGMQKAAAGFWSTVGDKISSAGKWLYNTVPTGRYLLNLLNARHMTEQIGKLQELMNTRGALIYRANLLRKKALQAGDKTRVSQLDAKLRLLNIRQEGSQKLFNSFDARRRGNLLGYLTAMRHQVLGSPIHTLLDYAGVDTGARDIMDPRNYLQLKDLPPGIKKQLELQVSHAGVTDVVDTVLMSAAGMGGAARAGTKLAPYMARGLGRVGIPAAYAPALSTAGVMAAGLGVRGIAQNTLAALQRKYGASYGNPNALLALVPGFPFANYAGFGQLQDIQNSRTAETIQVLNTPGSWIKQRFNTQQDAKVPYIKGSTVVSGILPSAVVSSVPALNAVDQVANILQYTALDASPAWRKYIQALDPTSILHLYLSGGRHNSSITNDLNEILAAKYGIIEPHNFMWPGRLHQATLNKLLLAHPDLGYMLANYMVTSHMNKMPAPTLPGASLLWLPRTGKPRSPVAQQQLASAIDALIANKNNTFGVMRTNPTASSALLLRQLKLNWEKQLQSFISSAPEQRRRLILLRINSKLVQKYRLDLEKEQLLMLKRMELIKQPHERLLMLRRMKLLKNRRMNQFTQLLERRMRILGLTFDEL